MTDSPNYSKGASNNSKPEIAISACEGVNSWRGLTNRRIAMRLYNRLQECLS
jgi:hypothetical protein